LVRAVVFNGWRGEVLLRGAGAPLSRLLPVDYEAIKRGFTPLLILPPLLKKREGKRG
jgi:hypothetical protein